MLDLIVCEVCGEVLVGGHRVGPKQRGYNPQPAAEILTADQPNLEEMPDRVSGQRRYETYGVFWPLTEGDPWSTQPTTNGVDRGTWKEAKLNVVTGELTRERDTPPGPDEVAGWVYYIAGHHPDEDPMPGLCPRCDADYRRRENIQTPLRNHRTGFQKACQVLATATVREMPMLSRKGKPNRKLVIFSDSRQDAAKLAAGVERDHFRDMVRLALLQALDSYWDQFRAIVKREVGNDPDAHDNLRAISPDLHAAVQGPMDARARQLAKEWANAYSQRLNELRNLLRGDDADNPEVRAELLDLVTRYPRYAALPDLCRAVHTELLRLGVPSGGTTYSLLGYRVDDERHPWHRAYRWEQLDGGKRKPVDPPVLRGNLPDRAHRLLDRVQEALMGELMYAIFPHRARTLEGLGQGAVTYFPRVRPADQIEQATLAAIRQLGLRRAYRYAQYFFPGGNNDDLPGYVRTYLAEGLGLQRPDDVKDQLVQSRAGSNGHNHLGLDPDNLYLSLPPAKALTPDGREARPGYRCGRCQSFYFHRCGGVCPDCGGRMQDKEFSRPVFDYYVYLSQLSGKAFRFRCEELTGQTPANDRPGRQRRFQEVFIRGEERKPEGIDLLSVTTTMEAGVDIGGLQAVMMANMPPRRFNYQQRVGRAGRRGAGLSLAVTFCRGRSHDDFYYQRTEKITGDPPPRPYVDLTSRPILERVANKEALRQAFAEVCPSPDAEGNPDSVHGEFGPTEAWRSTDLPGRIQAWLSDARNEAALFHIIDTLRVQTPWRDGQPEAARFRDDALLYFRTSLVSDITDAVRDPRYTQTALSELLANAGRLPMFGFPTRVRLLHTTWPNRSYPWPPEAGTIDRDLDIAISQFAPGSETVRDKAVHTARGVFSPRPVGNIVRFDLEDGFAPPLPGPNGSPVRACRNCQAVSQGGLPFVPCSRDAFPPPEPCPVCTQPALQVIDAREPRAFFTDLDPRDFDGSFEWTPRSTRPSIGFEHQPDPARIREVRNVKGAVLSETDILTVNDSGGDLGFDFQPVRVRRTWSSQDFTPIAGAYVALEQATDRLVPAGPTYCVSLLSRRRTDSLLVEMKEWPGEPGHRTVFADPQTVEGRAAWYSFAFFLRIAASELLDTDPTELDAGFRTVPLPDGRLSAQAFLCDNWL